MRLRFSIRDLLWLTVIVALAVGWWLDHRRLTEWDDTGGPGIIAPFPPMDQCFPALREDAAKNSDLPAQPAQ